MKKPGKFCDIAPPKYEAFIVGEGYKEVYEEFLAKTAEKFGKDSLGYQEIMKGHNLENFTGSDFLFNTEFFQYLPKNMHGLTLNDIENAFSEGVKLIFGWYKDTNQLVLSSNQAIYGKNQLIIDSLDRQLKKEGIEYSTENPVVITNPELHPDKRNLDKSYGIRVKLGKNTIVHNDERLAYGKSKILLGNIEKPLWTKKDGLSRLCLSSSGCIDVNNGSLAGSSDYGRVVAVRKLVT